MNKTARMNYKIITAMAVFIAVMAVVGYAFTITWNNPVADARINNDSAAIMLNVSIGDYTNESNMSNITFHYTYGGEGNLNFIGKNDSFNITPYSYPWVLPSLNGTYQLNATGYNLSDGSYNLNTFTTINVFIDNLKPVVSFDIQINNYNTSNPTVNINFSARDFNLSACTIFTSQGSWVPPKQVNYSIGQSYFSNNLSAVYADGTYVWNVWCNDSVNNWVWAGANRTFTVDYTSPFVLLKSPQNMQPFTLTNNVSINVTAIDTLIGLSNCTLYTNITNSVWQPNATKAFTGAQNSQLWAFNNIPNGNYKWNALCCDKLNNCGFNTTINFTFSINYNPPTVINWNRFKVFGGSTPPYAANGPGCVNMGNQVYNAVPGQNCPNNDSAYDLGAVWVDMDNNYLAWKIIAPNLTSTQFCSGTKGGEPVTGWHFAIEFDSDNNFSTGCPMNFPCYPGADFRIWADGTGYTWFEWFNQSRINVTCTAGGGMCYDTKIGSLYNITFNYTCGTPSILQFAINKSAVTLLGMRFVTNLGVPNQGPSENLGNFGEDMVMMGGSKDMMFEGDHPCIQYDGTNSTTCTTNSENISGADNCKWSEFEQICDPDMSLMTCSEFCGACNDTNACQQNGSKGKCMVVSAPPMIPPNAKIWDAGGNKMCVEDMSKFMMGGSGSCDDDCKYCYSNNTCINSAYPNPIGIGSGCKWIVDSYFNKSWCDLRTYSEAKLICGAESLDRCFNDSVCTSNGGTWNSAYSLCYNAVGGTENICFDGTDDDSDGFIDCKDSDCSRETFCGGDIDILTNSQFGADMNPMDAMKMQMFQDMDPSPPMELFPAPQNTSLPMQIDIRGFMIKDMGTSLGLGIRVEDMAGSNYTGGTYLCGAEYANTTIFKYYYFIDTDGSNNTGCNVTINSVKHSGFEYRYEYEIHNGTGVLGVNYNALEIRRGYRCLPNGNFSLFPAKIAGAPEGMFDGLSIPCAQDVAIVSVDKADLGNPKGNIRFIAATASNDTTFANANDTALGPGNKGIYYTPGTSDFTPNNCFANPMACGTAFSIVGGGKFMPFEDCFPSSGDEDMDGYSNCDDSDCQMAPWCSGTDYITNDKTAPTMNGNKVNTFRDFVVLQWTTNEPTNGTVSLYTGSCFNLTINNFTDTGNPSNPFDDYRPWHDLGIKNNTLDSGGVQVTLNLNSTYYYRIKICDKASNCGTSACLTFTTESLAQQVQFKFDFAPSLNSLVNTTVFKYFNGSAYVNMNANATTNQSDYLKDAKIKFQNDDTNWAIEFEGVDFSAASNYDMSSAFNISNLSGDIYVGMTNQKWLDLVQNLGVDSVIITIPGQGNTLMKCNENNLSDCSDVTTQANRTEIGPDYTKWKIPTSLGFSTYGTASYSVTLASDRTSYKAYPSATVIYTLTNANTSLADVYNLTINNTNIPGVTFNISYWNATSSAWVYAISNNNTYFSSFNFSESAHKFKIIVTMGQATGANWTINFSLFTGSEMINSFTDFAYLDAISLSAPTGGASIDTLTQNFSFSFYAGDTSTNQTCQLLINNIGYGSVAVTNGTTTGIIPNTTLSDGTYTWNISCLYGTETNHSISRVATVAVRPSVIINTPVSGANLTGNVTLNATVSDLNNNLAVVLFQISNSTHATNYTTTNISSSFINATFATTAYTDGLYNISVFANDSAGNTNSSIYKQIRIDNTAPTISFSVANNSNITSQQALTLTITENGTGLYNNSYVANCSGLSSTNFTNATAFYPYNVSGCSSDQVVTITVTATDYATNTRTYVYTYRIDVTQPTVTLYSPASGQVFNITTVLNWSATDSFTNISYVVYYLDSNPKVSLVGAINTTGINFSAGYHTIYIVANDSVNNSASTSSRTFYVTGQQNVTLVAQALNSSIGTTHVQNVIIQDNSGNALSGNQWVNQTLKIVLITNSTGTLVNASLVISDGSYVNWGANFSVDSSTTGTSAINVANNWTTTIVTTVHFNTSLDSFLPDPDTYYGSVVIPFNLSNGNQITNVWWFENESDLTDDTEVSSCITVGNSSPYNATWPTPCYNVTGAYSSIVYVPHFSDVPVGNDTTAPALTINKPSASKTTASEYFNFTTSLDANSCSFQVIYSNTSGGMSITNETQTGTFSTVNNVKYCLSSNVVHFKNLNIESNYTLKVNITDVEGNQNITYRNITVTDTTAPVITFNSTGNVTATYTAPSITWLSNEYTNASVEYGTATTLGTTAGGTTFGNSLTMLVSLPALSASTLYYFNITTCDYAGNCNESGTYNFTTSAAAVVNETVVAASTSGGFSGAIVTQGQSAQQMWTVIEAGAKSTMALAKDAIPIIEISFEYSEKATNANLKVVELATKPSTTSLEGTVYKYMSITATNLKATSLQNIKLKFKVLKSWLTTNAISQNDVVLYRYADNKWNLLATKVLSSDATAVYYESTTSGFSYFAVGAKGKEPPKIEEKPVVQPVTQPPVVQPAPDQPPAPEPQITPEKKPWFSWFAQNKAIIALIISTIILAGAIIGYEHYTHHKQSKEEEKKESHKEHKK